MEIADAVVMNSWSRFFSRWQFSWDWLSLNQPKIRGSMSRVDDGPTRLMLEKRKWVSNTSAKANDLILKWRTSSHSRSHGYLSSPYLHRLSGRLSLLQLGGGGCTEYVRGVTYAAFLAAPLASGIAPHPRDPHPDPLRPPLPQLPPFPSPQHRRQWGEADIWNLQCLVLSHPFRGRRRSFGRVPLAGDLRAELCGNGEGI